MNKQRVAIVTGGAQGIGKIISKSLLSQKMHVVVFDSDKEAGQEFMNEMKQHENLRFDNIDVSSENEVKDAVHKVITKHESINILVNNAGISVNKPMAELSLDEWHKVLNTNLTGTFLCSKHCEPHLKKAKGSVINLCSTRAFMSEPDTEAYSATKGGIFALTHAMSMSMGPEVRVNCISPGWIDVSMHQKKSQREIYQARAEDHEQHPAGRIGKAEDVANMVLFLANPENNFITGQNFTIDGGMTKKMIYV